MPITGGRSAAAQRRSHICNQVEFRMVRLQSSHDQRCIFRRVPAVAPTNHARRMALAV